MRNVARARPVEEHRLRDFDYTLRKLRKCQYMYIADTEKCGLGVFAARRFNHGEIVMIDADGDYYEQVFTYRELLARGIGLENTLQVGPDAFKLPTGSIDDFTNHSCDPNTGIRLITRGTIILALRDIEVHEELTYDYSTYLHNPHESMTCGCGAPNCRGVIGNFETLPENLKRRYLSLGVVGDFARTAAIGRDARR